MVILTIGQLVNVSTGAVGPLLVMTGRPVQWTSISNFSLMLQVGLAFLLIPSYGMVGGAVSTAAATSSKFTLRQAQVRHSLGIWPYDRRYVKGLLAAGISLAPQYVVRALPDIQPWSRLVLGGLACGTSFALALMALQFDPEDRQLLGALRRRIVALR
jgi:O-antigen/teichoic acid export membrane protein